MAEVHTQFGNPAPAGTTAQTVDPAGPNASANPADARPPAQAGVDRQNADASQPATGGRRFRVLHNGFGPFPGKTLDHPNGHVFSEEEFKRIHAAPPNANADQYYGDAIQRGLKLGAIAEVPQHTPLERTPVGPEYGGTAGQKYLETLANHPYQHPTMMAGDGRPGNPDEQRKAREDNDATATKRNRALSGEPAEPKK